MIARLAGAAASWLLFTVVALAPLPFGSNEPTAIAFWCIALGICLVMVPVPPLRTGELLLVALAAVVVAAYGFVLHEQLSASPWLAKPDPIWKEASDALGMALTPSAAIAHGQPFLTLGRPLGLHAGDRLRVSGRQGWRPCPATDEGHRLVRRCLCLLRHPRPSVRSKPYPGAEQGSLSQFGHRDFHQPQYGGDLFRFVRGGVVGPLVGPHAARDEGAADQVAGDADGRADGAAGVESSSRSPC